MTINYLKLSRFGIFISVAAMAASPLAAQTVYVENFDTAPPNVGGAFSVSIGGDVDGAASNNKEVTMGQWGLSANGSIAGANIRPQVTGAINARLAGIFLDSTVINAGAGTYTLEFDIIGDAGAGASDNAFIYVSQGSGIDATSFLVLDLANAGFGGFEPLSATGTADAEQLASLGIDDTTLSQANARLTFIYDGTSTLAVAFGAFDSGIAFDNLSIYKTATYDTDFQGFVSGMDFIKNFNVAYGSSDMGDPVLNTGFLDETLVQWGITSNGNDFAAGFMRPQQSPATLGPGNNANNVKMAGVVLDPVLFPSAGDYTITFDITGDPLGNPAYRAYVFAGSGYDFDESGDQYLSLSLSSNGFLGYTGLTAVGTGVTASELVMQDISDLAVDPSTNTVSITFTYDGTSAIAFSVGGFNNAALIDNFSIAPFEAPSYTVYGTGFASYNGGTSAVQEFQGGVGNFQYDGTDAGAAFKVLREDVPQWGGNNAAVFTSGALKPQNNPAANVKLACVFLSPEYFMMGSGTYTISFEMTGDPTGNKAYRAYVFKGSGTNGTTDYLAMDVSANGFGGLTGLTGTGAAAPTTQLLVERDLSFQSNLSGTVDVSIDFTYTEGDVICFGIGGFNNATIIDNLKVTTTNPPPGTVVYSTGFDSFTPAADEVPGGEFKQDFNIAYGSEKEIAITRAVVNGSGEFEIDFLGFPSTTGNYQVLKSSALSGFIPLASPLFVDTDGSGIGTVAVPATELVDPAQFFSIGELFNTKVVGSEQWGITGNGNAFADGVARPQTNPATNVKMIGVILDPSVFTEGAGTYTASFEISGDPSGNTAYRAYAYAGSGYDLSGSTADRLVLSLSAGGFGGYAGLTGPTTSQLIEVGAITNGTTLSNASAIDMTRTVSFDFTWDGVSAIAIAIGGFNNASTIDNVFVTYVAP